MNDFDFESELEAYASAVINGKTLDPTDRLAATLALKNIYTELKLACNNYVASAEFQGKYNEDSVEDNIEAAKELSNYLVEEHKVIMEKHKISEILGYSADIYASVPHKLIEFGIKYQFTEEIFDQYVEEKLTDMTQEPPFEEQIEIIREITDQFISDIEAPDALGFLLHEQINERILSEGHRLP